MAEQAKLDDYEDKIANLMSRLLVNLVLKKTQSSDAFFAVSFKLLEK